MDVNELSADELRKLADEKSNVKTLDVDGLIVHVDMDKCKSWKAFRLMANMTSDLTPDTLQTMLDFVEAISDVDEDIIVEHCGGDDATLEDVVRTISTIIAESQPKNF